MENNFPFSLFNFQFEEKELNNVSGKPKQGLDWAGWDTHIFDDDTRIDELIDAQGWTGFGIYFYLCQKAYATDGYFYRWTYANAPTTARKMGAGIKSDTVRQVVSLCLQIGLFDKGLFDRESILTNKDMQERFMIAVEKRSAAGKTVNGNYWLLSPENTKAYIIIPQNRQSLPENAYSLPENATKESKVKERKVKESKVCGKFQVPCRNGVFTVDEEYYTELTHTYPNMNIDECFKKYIAYMKSNPNKQKNLNEIKGSIEWWINRDEEDGKYRKNNVTDKGYYEEW